MDGTGLLGIGTSLGMFRIRLALETPNTFLNILIFDSPDALFHGLLEKFLKFWIWCWRIIQS